MSRLEIVDDSGPLKLSASQAAKLGKCEMRWVLGKLSPEEGGSGPRPSYFILGDLVHAGFQAWGSGKSTMQAINALAKEFGLLITDPLVLKANGILSDWQLLNGDPSHILMGIELPFDIEIPGTKGVRVRGFLDGIERRPVDGVRTHDTYRIHEYKTMGRWGREAYARDAVDTHLYIWAASQQYPNVTGLDFQAISTYDYKPSDPPKPEDDAKRKFRLISVEYDQRYIDRMLADLRNVATRAQALLRKPSLAIRNIGDDCRRCEHKTQCLTPWHFDADFKEVS